MAHELFEQGENNKLFVVGELGRQYFTKEGLEVDTEFKYTVQNPSLHRARAVSYTHLDVYKRQTLCSSGRTRIFPEGGSCHTASYRLLPAGTSGYETHSGD